LKDRLMPIFMDRHDLSGVTAGDVARAHQADLNIQDRYHCRALTYWFDEKRGTAFCLIEAPDENAVRELHAHAHGLVPHEVIEVQRGVVEAFLGRVEDPEPPGTAADLSVIVEPAYRAIMCVEICRRTGLTGMDDMRGDAAEMPDLSMLISEIIAAHGGQEVADAGRCSLSSFPSVPQSIACAQAIQRDIGSFEAPRTQSSGTGPQSSIQIQIGLSAGIPVAGDSELFGETVRAARRLCAVAPRGSVLLSPGLGEFLTADSFRSRSAGVLVKLSRDAEEFLHRLMDVMEEVWNENNMSIAAFGKRMGLSKSQLYRKTVSLTGCSPNEFMRNYRLQKAAEMIEAQAGSVTEIAYATGFDSLSYFSKCFKNAYHLLPSQYVMMLRRGHGVICRPTMVQNYQF
jgi:AraC-like DNA-binding protein